jgi:uncharacterized protein (TIGR02757 family)
MLFRSAKSTRDTETMREKLEGLYFLYNDRKYVHPDPLEFLYDYPDPLDMELAGLIASSLAYGRVAQILKSVSNVLDKMNRSPRAFITGASVKSLSSTFSGFKHRFTTGDEMASMLIKAKGIIKRYGSLNECFMAGYNENEETVVPALTSFAKQFNECYPDSCASLLPEPYKGSACKRLNLFMRWMVRKDIVDPGGWDGISPSKLVIPLDTHMHRICTALKLTDRKQADMRTAMEITENFRKISPEDPVRYDFAITRLGIRNDSDPELFLAKFK